MRECPGDRQRRLNRHFLQQGGHRIQLGCAIGAARVLGRVPHLFDAPKERFAFMLPEDAPELLAEQPHVIAQWLMRIH